MTISKIKNIKPKGHPAYYQTDIFDFLGEDDESIPFQPVESVRGTFFLPEETRKVLEKSPFKDQRKLWKYINDFIVPVYVLPDYPDKIFTRAICFNKRFRDVGFISTDLQYVSLEFEVTDRVRIREHTFDAEEGLTIYESDGTRLSFHPIEIALMSFLGVGLGNDPLLEKTTDKVCWGDIAKLDQDLSMEYFDFHPIYIFEGLKHPIVGEVAAEAEQVETKEVETVAAFSQEQVQLEPPQSNLIPLDAYGLKAGYWYNPDTRTVSTSTGNLIDDHKAKRHDIVILEVDNLTDNGKLALAEIRISDLHNVCYLGQKLLPSLHYYAMEEDVATTRVDLYTAPLTLTPELKEKLKTVKGGDNRQAAAVVYGNPVTPAHTKMVKAYRDYLKNQKD